MSCRVQRPKGPVSCQVQRPKGACFLFGLPGKVRVLPGKEAQGTNVRRSKRHVSSLACRVRPVSFRVKKAQWACALRGKEGQGACFFFGLPGCFLFSARQGG